jgi:hypothetical protein
MVIRMDLLPVQISQLAQTTIVTLTRTSQQLLIPMVILILHLRLPQHPRIIIHTHTLIRLRLLIYHVHPPIRILYRIRQPIVLTIHMLQPRQTHIHTCMSRTIIRTRIRIPRRLWSLMCILILIHICRMIIRLRTGLGQCQRVIAALEGQ